MIRISIILSLLIFPVMLLAQDAAEVNSFLDAWHHDAAVADQEAYFEKIDKDGVYIGTDATEVWSKQAFFDWSRPYFEAKRVWKFRGSDRNISFTEDGKYAWFDELVNSSAGVWRGSGVLKRYDDGWKIKQYVLSMTVPNDLFDKVIKLIKEYESTQEDAG